MALQVRDINGNTQILPEWIDPVYRASGIVTAAQGAGSACDLLLFTAGTANVTRLLWARFRLMGGGTAYSGVNTLQMGRVVAAPTGQTNVAVTNTQHDPNASAASSTVAITPSTTQTPGTTFTVLSTTSLANSLFATGGDKLAVCDAEFACGPFFNQQPIIVLAGKFVTIRASIALPSASTLAFDLGWSEATY